MALMLGKLYTALEATGLPAATAAAAAEEVAAYENRIANIETKLTVLTWMIAFNLALTVALVGKAFR